MHVTYLSDGNQTRVKGFAAVYGTGDVLAPIRQSQCALGEVTFAYGNGTSRFCGVVGNGLRGAPPCAVHLDCCFARIIGALSLPSAMAANAR